MQLGLEILEYAYQSSIFKRLNTCKQLLKSETINFHTKNIFGLRLRHVSDVQLFMCRTNALKTINNEVAQMIIYCF